MTNLLIERNEYFTVEHARSCNIPGYLIIEPQTPVTYIWKLPRRAQQELGMLQARCSRAVQEAVSPMRVYCLTFAEESLNYHCHIFPRSLDATAQYLEEFPKQKELIHGPLFFDWARERYRGDVLSNLNILGVVEKIRTLIAKSKSESPE